MSTDRIVKVTLAASVSNYVDGLEKARKKTAETADEGKRLAAQKDEFDKVGKTLLAAGTVAAVGLGLAIGKAAEFDQAMSNVQAATHESAENMAALKQAALDAGAQTVYSATESAGAIEELAKAGLSTTEILNGGLTGALSLAAAGQLDVADAAGIAATTLQQFGLEGDQAGHVADLLAAGAGKAMGDVTDLSQALSQSGTVASQFGISVDDTVGTLSAFASAGLLGSDAGTSFRTMLLRLANPTGQAADQMQQLGISAYDAQGKFVGIESLAGQLKDQLSGLTQEQRNASLAIIFGQDAIRAANVLYTNGAKGIADWTNKVDDAGYAADTAATRLDNLRGDIEKLQGSVDTSLIGIGESGQTPLRALVQGANEAVDSLNRLPAGTQTAIAAVTAVGSAVSLTSGAFFVGVPRVAAYREGLTHLGDGAQRASRLLGSLGKGAGIVAGLTAALTAAAAVGIAVTRQMRGTDEAIAKATTTNQSFLKSLDAVNRSSGTTASSVKGALNAIASGNVLGPIGLDILNLRDGITELGKGLTQIPLDDAVQRFQAWGSELGLTRKQMQTLLAEDGMKDFRDAIQAQLASTGQAADKQAVLTYALAQAEPAVKSTADAYANQASQVQSVADALAGLLDQIDAANGSAQSAVDANSKWLDSLAGISASVKDNGLSLDQHTAAGSKNAAMLAGVASDAQAAAKAQFTLDQQTMTSDAAAQKYADTLAGQRKKFEDAAIAAGFNKDEIHKLGDQIFQLPSEKEVKVIADTSSAKGNVNDFLAYVRGLPRLKINVDAKLGGDAARLAVTGTGSVIARAAGGILPCRPSRTDNMLIHAASGEFLVNSQQTARNRAALEYINGGGQIYGYANGGFIQPTYIQPSYGSGAPLVMREQVPTSLTVVDVKGALIGTMRVVAQREIDIADAADERTLMRGRSSR